MKISILLNRIKERLNSIYKREEQSLFTAIWILQNITKKTYAQLICQDNCELSVHQEIELEKILTQHIDKHMPLAYIFGHTPFLDLDIKVYPPILIPRDDTAYWCDYLIQKFASLKEEELNILDLCTGSGCIGLALAAYFSKSQIYAVDIDSGAIKLATENARHNKINNISIIESDLFENLSQDLKFDLIVANPPYLSQREWKELELSVKDWESKKALISSKKGLFLIENIIKQAPHRLKKNKIMESMDLPQLVIEIGHLQAEAVKNILIKNYYINIETIKDLGHIERAVTARVNICGSFQDQ